MDEPHFFADVDLPFHVWVREGRRWVLRDAQPRLARDARGGATPTRREDGGREPPPARG